MELTSAAFEVALLVLVNVILCQATSNQTEERVIVNIQKLPEPFDNEKLSVLLPNATTCHNLMGCFEHIPISKSDLDPFHIGTEFLFYARNAPDTSIRFKLIHNCLREDPRHCNLYPFDLEALSNAPFVPSRRTVIFVSGYLSKPPTDWERGCKKLWLELEDVNLIIVSWVGANSGSYPSAATNTRLISRQITVLLYYLAKLNGLDVTDDSFAERIYMVGHSLGAHISGFVGMDLGGALGRITGLDPAGPSFDSLHERFRLDRSDAQLVDAIHTNAGAVLLASTPRYGTGLMSGHVDLYANDGSLQPGCLNVMDIKGCSHGKSHKFYMAFLQHEVSMRKYFGNDYSPLYRLNAYIGKKFDDFRRANSLVKHCPKTAHMNRDLLSSDLASCSIPVDYFTWYSEVKNELQSSHGIDFGPESRQNNSFYFVTSADTDDQMDHYLMKAHIAGVLQSRKFFGRDNSKASMADVLPDECDISFEVKMNSGISSSFRVEQYKLVQQKDHYDVIAPYLASNIKSKYQIAKLDSQDFYLTPDANGSKVISDEKQLLQSFLEVFPKTVSLSGLHVDEKAAEKRRKERENPGFLGSIKKLLNYVRGKKNDMDVADEHTISCKLAVKHLAVRPLRLFHRMVIAFYSVHLHENDASPKILLLRDNETEIPKHSFLDHGLPSAVTTRLQLDTIIIGPYDKSFIKLPEIVEEENEEETAPIDRTTYVIHESYEVSPLTWVIPTLLVAVIIVSLAVITSLKVRRVQPSAKQALLMESISTISYPVGAHSVEST